MVDPGKKRLVAEWEPALGAFVTWPAALPGALLRDLALDAHLWVLVTDAASEIDAAAWFASQGVSPDRVTLSMRRRATTPCGCATGARTP